ncbi:MAG: DEAD/DEAH box helicase family protein [Nitrospirae bacterium]|nr:DEAD/DEAH box helicase family protein [Nitrospirota bacterium]
MKIKTTRRTTYGNTWWGKAWIDAMERIDYNTNRLPRGRRYANNGSVKEIKITDGHVSAKVQGSMRLPYKINIDLLKFKDTHLKKITHVIGDNPAIASALTLGHLPEELLTLLKAGNVDLLPASWKDVESRCSCPDWANPCKHLAAVYYLIANEIDKNPFLVFNLRGIQTEEITGAAGLTSEYSYDNWQNYLGKYVPYANIDLKDDTGKSADYRKDDYPDLSFSKMDIDNLSLLLRDNPMFYKRGDFKSILLRIYKYATTKVDTILVDEDLTPPEGLDFYLFYTPKDELSGFLSPAESIPANISANKLANKSTTIPATIPGFMDGKQVKMEIPLAEFEAAPPNFTNLKFTGLKFTKQKGMVISVPALFDYFTTVSLNASATMTASAKFLNFTSSLALALIRAASFVPEVFSYDKDEFTIRYVPLVNDDKVKSAMKYHREIMPVNMVFRQRDKTVLSKDGAYDVLSVYITHLVYYFISEITSEITSGIVPGTVSATGISLTGDKLINTFINGEIFKAVLFEESNTAKSINDWLENFSFRKKDISPLIKIETAVDAGPETGGEDNFLTSVDIQNKADPVSPAIPLSDLFTGKKEIYSRPIDEVRTEVLRQLVIASDHMPQLKGIVNGKGKVPAVIGMQDMADILGKVKNIFNVLGIGVMIPKGLRELARPQLTLKASLKGKTQTVSYLSFDTLLDYSWEIAIGDKTIGKKEFLQLVKSAKGVVKYKDEYLLLNPDEVKSIIDRLSKPVPEMSAMEMIHSALIGETDGTLFAPDEALKRILENMTKPEDIALPSSLNAQLRPYQEIGMKWLYTNSIRGFGSCLADDMGLGKTITVISVILKLKEDGRLDYPVLVICPTTLVGNWVKECNKFAPSLNVSIYHGMERKLSPKNRDMVITTYGTLRQDIQKFSARNWGMVVIDEAQNIKNPETTQSKAVKSLKGGAYIAMSGTPVENRLTELWSIMDFVNKGYMGSLASFKTRYALPIEKYRNIEQIDKLRRVTAPFVLRRLKSDRSIIKDLPDKIVFDEYCYLTKDQAALYQQVVDGVMKEIAESAGINRKGLIFKLITSLKQICNHPVHYTKKGKAAKEFSGKSEKSIDLLSKILASKEKALIFTQYKEMGEILSGIIKNETNEEPLFFHGGLQRNKRDKMVDDFQGKDKHKIMIISLKAGGTGLNLTSATNVIHYDLWWNPAVEAQATDRTYRIGQDKNVIVHRLITLGTFEEKIDEMIKAKKELADLTVVTGEQWLTELSNKELKDIFSLAKETQA